MHNHINSLLVRTLGNENYFGIDACSGDTVWPAIDRWNKEYPDKKLDTKIFIGADRILDVMAYLGWIAENWGNDQAILLHYSTETGSKGQLNIDGYKFDFIGFECVYLKDEYMEPILFSPFYNEKYDEQTKRGYQQKQNRFHLFDNLNDVEDYQKFRKELIQSNRFNIETAFEEYDLDIVRISIYNH